MGKLVNFPQSLPAPDQRLSFLTRKVGIIIHPLGFVKIKYYIASTQPGLDQRNPREL